MLSGLLEGARFAVTTVTGSPGEDRTQGVFTDAFNAELKEHGIKSKTYAVEDAIRFTHTLAYRLHMVNNAFFPLFVLGYAALRQPLARRH